MVDFFYQYKFLHETWLILSVIDINAIAFYDLDKNMPLCTNVDIINKMVSSVESNKVLVQYLALKIEETDSWAKFSSHLIMPTTEMMNTMDTFTGWVLGI